MSRFHVHLHVEDIENSIRFYSALFGTAPARLMPGYAKWMLDDPKLNFAISMGTPVGVSHLGFQVDTDDELAEISSRAQEAAGTVLKEKGARCCYATGNKAWAQDPQGVVWETFQTTGELDEPGSGAEATFQDDLRIAASSGCGCAVMPAKTKTVTQDSTAVCCG